MSWAYWAWLAYGILFLGIVGVHGNAWATLLAFNCVVFWSFVVFACCRGNCTFVSFLRPQIRSRTLSIGKTKPRVERSEFVHNRSTQTDVVVQPCKQALMQGSKKSTPQRPHGSVSGIGDRSSGISASASSSNSSDSGSVNGIHSARSSGSRSVRNFQATRGRNNWTTRGVLMLIHACSRAASATSLALRAVPLFVRAHRQAQQVSQAQNPEEEHFAEQ